MTKSDQNRKTGLRVFIVSPHEIRELSKNTVKTKQKYVKFFWT